MRLALVLACAALLLPLPGRAEPVHGRVQLQDIVSFDGAQSLAATLASRTRNDALGELRLNWSPRNGAWSFDAAYVIDFDAGGTPELTRAEDALDLFPQAPPSSWFDLTDSILDRRRLVATQRLDRLSLGYASGHWALRVGRQALTWGAGQVFRPMDLFDPFAPEATDTEYKPGVDMFYGQYLFDSGADVQAVVVPRPARRNGPLTGNASSFALHARAALGRLQASGLLARDHGDMVAGLGMNGPLGGATWNAEVVATFVRGGGTHISVLANIASAGRLWGRDASYFAEYFHNGFGAGGRHAVDTLPAPLVDRLLRGQLFTTGRDYVAAGARLQWTPLLDISPSVIVDLDDRSLFLLAEARWSLSDNLTLGLGGQLPAGPRGGDYGGLPLAGHGPPYVTQPARLYVRLRRYF